MVPGDPTAGNPQKPRDLALDAFRGLTVLGMLLVNNAAMGEFTPAQMKHGDWSGAVMAADFVFPWFLLAVGLSLPFSWNSAKTRGLERGFLLKALRRTLWLLSLGYLIDSAVARSPHLGLGVLQLIGLAYFVGACMIRTGAALRATVVMVLLLGYWVLLRTLPIPGLPAGTIVEGSNAVQYINDALLEPVGLRGLPSLIPTSALVLLGSVIGDYWRRGSPAGWRTFVAVGLFGVLLATVGWLWSYSLPMLKPIWTSSYIVFSGGLGLATLGILGFVGSVGRGLALAPLVPPGRNAIFAYVGSILFKVMILQVWTAPASWKGAVPNMSLQAFMLARTREQWGVAGGGWVYTISFVAAWYVLLVALTWKGWIVKL